MLAHMDESEARKALLDELGGRHTIAKDLGVGATAISNWLKDGFPRSRIPRLLQIARERGVKDVTLDRLIQMEARYPVAERSSGEAA
jgi:hypothetical protein